MSAPILVIRLMLKDAKTEHDPVEWLYFQDGASVGAPRSARLDQISKTLQEFSIPETCRIVLILPAQDVVMTRVHVPANQKRRKEQLVPYILEEHLNQPVADVFFASTWLPQSSDVGVAYCTKSRLEYWLLALENQQLKPDVVFPEQHLLPSQDASVFAIFDEQRVLVRHDHWNASVVPLEFARPWISRMVISQCEDEAITPRVTLLVDREGPVDEVSDIHEDLQNLAEEFAAEQRAAQEDALEEPASQKPNQNMTNGSLQGSTKKTVRGMAANRLNLDKGSRWTVKTLAMAQPVTYILASEAARLVIEHHSFQLLQGDYKAARRKRKSKYNWQAAAAVVLAFFIVKIGHTAFEYGAYASALKEIRQENIALFKQTFPEVTRIRGSLRRALSSEKAKLGKGPMSAPFLNLVMSTGASLNAAKGLQIQRMSFDDGQSILKIDLQVADYPELERIQKAIEQQALQVKIDGANKDDDGVTARLRISVG